MNASAPYFLWLPALAVTAWLRVLARRRRHRRGNAFFHLWATVSRSRYSPCVITGMLAYLLLGALGYWALLPTGMVVWATPLQAISVGVGFHVWSERNHRRRAAAKV